MSWGYRIMIVYIVFIAMILGMVFVASKQTNEMQDENYYSKELVYQSVIDGKNNLNALADSVTLSNQPGSVKIKLPLAASANITEGSVYFLCPSDEKKDLKDKLNVDANGEQSISRDKLKDGFYTIQISWKSNGKAYYSEQKFKVQ
ncbi:MAG TPA: FixH family protein [Saprospiraceae bacterium]|nr:FixH family protein [Saprospiraceae bacterium]HNB93282.1 FixH family protein [Saprospiraceae bacterium]HNG06694.1 FixH family protein [Saprospiraceae bacterium]